MMEKMICVIVNTTVMAVAQLIVFLRLSEFRFERKKVYFAAVFFTLTCCSLCIGLSIADQCDRTTELTLVTMTIPSLVFFFIISRYRGVRFFYHLLYRRYVHCTGGSVCILAGSSSPRGKLYH